MTPLHHLPYIWSSPCSLTSDPDWGRVPSSSQWLTCRSCWVVPRQRRQTGRVFGTGRAEGSGPPGTQHSWGRKQPSVQGTDSLNSRCLNCPLSRELPMIPNQFLHPLSHPRDGWSWNRGDQPVMEVVPPAFLSTSTPHPDAVKQTEPPYC